MVVWGDHPAGGSSSGRSRRHAVPPDEGCGDIDLSKTAALDIVKRKAGEHARTYYVVRCRSCGRLGSYEPLDQAQARVDQISTGGIRARLTTTSLSRNIPKLVLNLPSLGSVRSRICTSCPSCPSSF